MIDPPSPRRTAGDRIAAALLVLPGAATLRRRWQVWQGRRRLYQRFPNTMKVVGFVVSFAVTLALVMAVYVLLPKLS